MVLLYKLKKESKSSKDAVADDKTLVAFELSRNRKYWK